MSQQFIKNDQGTFDERYRDFTIRPVDTANGVRFAVYNPDGTPSEYLTCRTADLAKQVIDTKHRRCELLIEEAAKKIEKPAIDAAAILSAADRFVVNARNMGRRENSASDLI